MARRRTVLASRATLYPLPQSEVDLLCHYTLSDEDVLLVVGFFAALCAVAGRAIAGWMLEALRGLCCNFQKSARERLVGSTRVRLMRTLRPAC